MEVIAQTARTPPEYRGWHIAAGSQVRSHGRDRAKSGDAASRAKATLMTLSGHRERYDGARNVSCPGRSG